MGLKTSVDTLNIFNDAQSYLDVNFGFSISVVQYHYFSLGMLFVNAISDVLLRRSLGVLALFLTGLLIIRDVWYPSKTYNPSWWQGALVGAFAGFCSTVAHAAGPIMALFLIAQKLDKRTFVASSAGPWTART